jgi:four helix bundle protein
MENYNLEDRLLEFSSTIVEIVRVIPASKEGTYLSNQLIRSGISPLLNYGEAISGESRKDFVHKIKVVLKELRETFNCLRLIHKINIVQEKEMLEKAISENNELISIFVQSVKTAKRNMEESGMMNRGF